MRRSLVAAVVVSLASVASLAAGCSGEDPGDGSFGGGSSESSPASNAAASTGTGEATSSTASSVATTVASVSASSGGDGGGPATCTDLGDACTQCEATACPVTYCDCYEDSECLALSACIVGCGGTAECYQGCATDHPTAISHGALLVDCAATSCPEACPGYVPLTTCQECLYTRCQDEMNACIANPDCTELLYCLGDCTDAECTNDCYFEHPDGTGDAGPVGTCLQDECPGECG